MIKLGEIYRYNSGSTALCRLHSHHAGGFHAEQYFGGFIFVLPENLYEATQEEKSRFREEQCKIHKRRYG